MTLNELRDSGSVLTVTAVAPTITLSTGEAEHFRFLQVTGPNRECKDPRPLKVGEYVQVKTVDQGGAIFVERVTIKGIASGCTYLLYNDRRPPDPPPGGGGKR